MSSLTTERVEHLEILKRLLENQITNLIVMKGGMGKKQRQAALNALESRPDDLAAIQAKTVRKSGLKSHMKKAASVTY